MSKRSRREPPPPEFFIDRSLGSEVVPSALEAAGSVAHRMADFYGDHLAEENDVEWIEEVTELGYVILTKDESIRRDEAEKEAVLRCGAKMFCLSTPGLTGRQMADRFVHHRHRMIQHCRKDGPFIYAVLAASLERVNLTK